MSRAKGRSLRLHPKYGVNPTMPVCFWCGEATGEIAMLGAGYKGEAPMSLVINYDPCEKCRANMALGFLVVQCGSIANNPPLDKNNPNSRPTGRWCVIKREVAHRLFGDSPQWPSIELHQRVLLDLGAWNKMGFPSD
jgi:hypothetical protein